MPPPSIFYSAVRKSSIVEAYFEKKNYRLVARECGVSEKSVRKWVKQFREGKLNRPSKAGRPKITTERQDDLLLKIADEHFGCDIEELTQIASRRLRSPISSKTYRRRLKAAHYIWRRAYPRVKLTADHKQKRVAWAEKHQHETAEFWESAIFTDEKKWTVARGLAFGYAPHNREVTQTVVLYPNTFQTWGCFSAAEPGPLVVYRKRSTGTLNGEGVVNIIRDSLLPYAQKVFKSQSWRLVQDNAPCHSATCVQEFLKDHQVDTIRWPPNSCDLNPIENLWGIMAKRMKKKSWSNEDEYEQVLRGMWNSIPRTTLLNLARSMTSRIKQVIRSKGDRITY